MCDKPQAARLPTLTEVLSVGAVDDARSPAAPTERAAADDERVARVVEAVGARLAPMIEERLDEAMAPLLAQLSQSVAQHASAEVLALLRDELPRLVAGEIQRQG